jgi:hypothetical protein
MSFFSAKFVVTATPKGKTKSKKKEVTIDGLEQLAEIDAMIKNLSALREDLDRTVKDKAREIFIDLGQTTRPENFRGVDGDAEASIEFRKRSTRSVLTPAEVEAFEKLNIPVETIQDVSETYIINPAYAGDSALLEKIDNALKKVKNLPEDFILKQGGTSRKVVGDDTVTEVFSKGLIRQFFDTIGVLAVKPKLDVTDISVIAKKVMAYIKSGQHA